MKRFNSLLLVFIAILSSTLSALLFVALWPYLDILGKLFVGFLAVLVGCATLLAIVSTWHWIGILAARRRHAQLSSWLVANGDMSIYMRPDGSYDHVSAEHAQAMLPPPNVTVQEIKEIDSEEIIKLHQKRLSLRAIAKATGHSYYAVQKCVAEWDKAVGEAKEGQRSGIDPVDWRSQT